MSRTVKDAKLETRTAREKLARGRRHWRSLGGNVHLGYLRGQGEAGRWLLRTYAGQQKYTVQVLRSAQGEKVVADDVADANGVTVLSFTEAQKRAHMVHGERARTGAGLPMRSGDAFTVEHCLLSYCDWLDRNRRTGKDARSRAMSMIVPVLGTIPCDRLTTAQIEAWLHSLAQSPPRIRGRKAEVRFKAFDPNDAEARRARQNNANRTLVTLRASLTKAWRDGQIASNAAWIRVRPFHSVNAARVDYLTAEEARRLIRAAEPAFARLVQVALATGCRYGELIALRVEDFRPESGTLHIRVSKSGKSRHVVLTEEGIALCEGLVTGRPPEALILTKADGSPWRRSNQNGPLGRACAQARIRTTINFHMLRHTWASLSIQAGMPLMVAAKNLGHRDTTMVERHYGHLAPSFIADSVRQHAPRFGFGPEKVVPVARQRRV